MKSLLNLIGNTPLIEIEDNIFAKMEGFNLTGSIKDRTALAMVEAAEKEGRLKKGVQIAEPTSGNTGIALAMISAIKGYELSVIIPESTSEEKKRMILTYGARIISVPNEKFREPVIKELKEKEERGEIVFLNQYENINNKKVHYEKTGEEILNQMEGKEINYFVAGIGTGGTITGISKKLKEHFPNIKIIGVQPKKGTIIEGLRSIKDGYVPPVLELDLIDEIIDLDPEESVTGRNYLAKKGILVGLSSGAVFKTIKNLNLKGNVVTIFPDRGERYLK
ncbi:MAG TPA: PLP-dependent cysteine synthase family protein [Candidatus Pacearchaeota archaeon]|nr:PLP-dependent cysteine synthase family protein [Candidatus Pacearchaeota archaeon]